MNQRITTSVLVAAGSVAFSSCSQLEGHRVDSVATTARTGAGIPYVLSKPTFTISVRALKGDKDATPTHDIEIGTKPDPTQRFEVRLENGWFVSDELSVQLEEDGRLSSLGTKSTDKTAALIKGMTDLAAQVLDAAALSSVNDLQARLEAWQRRPGVSLTDSQIRLLVASHRYLHGISPQPANFASASALVNGLLPPLEDAAKDATRRHARSPSASTKTEVIDTYGLLETLREMKWLLAQRSSPRSSSPSPSKRIADLLDKLNKTVEATLADYVENGTKRPFDDAVDAYKIALARVLQAHKDFRGRDLVKERKAITDFLETAIATPPGTSHGDTFETVVKQLAALDAAVTKLITVAPKKKEKKVLPLGSDVVKRIDAPDAVAVDRKVQPEGFAKELLVAKALVEFGFRDGIVLHQPMQRKD